MGGLFCRPDGVLAWNSKGERLLLFMGVIDILQCYKLRKKLEHTMKAAVLDGESISVCHPAFYSKRFQDFMAEKVFRKVPETFPVHNRSNSSLNREDKGTNPLSTDSSPEELQIKRNGSGHRKSGKNPKLRPEMASTSIEMIDGGGSYSSNTIATGQEKHSSLHLKSNFSSKAPDLILDTANAAANLSLNSPKISVNAAV